MGKLFRNGVAFIRGGFMRTASLFDKNMKVNGRLRVFGTAEMDISRGACLHLGRGVKIRERAYLSVRKGAVLNIDDNASVGMDCKVVCHEKIEIGAGTLLSPNVLIYDHDHVFSKEEGVARKQFKTAPISIGRNCWIGANTVILKGTEIGDNCIVGAGCVLKGKYPDNTTIVQKRLDHIINREV